MGVIYDRLADVSKASTMYKKAVDLCQLSGDSALIHTPYYQKSITNYAVTLEKLGQRT